MKLSHNVTLLPVPTSQAASWTYGSVLQQPAARLSDRSPDRFALRLSVGLLVTGRSPPNASNTFTSSASRMSPRHKAHFPCGFSGAIITQALALVNLVRPLPSLSCWNHMSYHIHIPRFVQLLFVNFPKCDKISYLSTPKNYNSNLLSNKSFLCYYLGHRDCEFVHKQEVARHTYLQLFVRSFVKCFTNNDCAFHESMHSTMPSATECICIQVCE